MALTRNTFDDQFSKSPSREVTASEFPQSMASAAAYNFSLNSQSTFGRRESKRTDVIDDREQQRKQPQQLLEGKMNL